MCHVYMQLALKMFFSAKTSFKTISDTGTVAGTSVQAEEVTAEPRPSTSASAEGVLGSEWAVSAAHAGGPSTSAEGVGQAGTGSIGR